MIDQGSFQNNSCNFRLLGDLGSTFLLWLRGRGCQRSKLNFPILGDLSPWIRANLERAQVVTMNKAALNISRRLTESYPAFSQKLLFKLRLSPSPPASATFLAASQPVLCPTTCLVDPDPDLQTEDLLTMDLPGDHWWSLVTVSRPDPDLLTPLSGFTLDLPCHCGSF